MHAYTVCKPAHMPSNSAMMLSCDCHGEMGEGAMEVGEALASAPGGQLLRQDSPIRTTTALGLLRTHTPKNIAGRCFDDTPQYLARPPPAIVSTTPQTSSCRINQYRQDGYPRYSDVSERLIPSSESIGDVSIGCTGYHQPRIASAPRPNPSSASTWRRRRRGTIDGGSGRLGD
jgi:hypothetical protein